MTPLLCLSPTVLDQSFPRDDDELRKVAATLGQIQGYLEEARAGLIMTDCLRAIAASESFDPTAYDESQLLRDLHRLFQQWVLQSHEGIEEIDVSEVENERYEPHPAPEGCEGMGLISVWQDEAGRILAVHDVVCHGYDYFIGVACESAFAGGSLGDYRDADRRRCFPLVGPTTFERLSDAYVWDVPHDAVQKRVGLDDFRRNCRYIGAVDVSQPSGGSHCKVRFDDGSSWPLDTNCDPVPAEHLRTLSRTTGYPTNVLKDCLVNGRPPRRVCRLQEYRA